YDVDHDARMSYLKYPKENINKYARRYLQAKDFFEEMNNRIAEMETLADYGIRIINETDIMALKMEIEKYPLDCMMAMKKQFFQRLAKIQASSRKIPSGHGIEGNNKFLYMSVIEILEKLYLAFEKKDLDGCTVLIKTAECLMPDDSDEIGDAIWLQINAMKDRLGYA
ncbi:MAG: hypothetical protein K2I92_03895, partial [Muribaculaceae bacterium]|nr:hypothetical protein [Muribaculaceae bacterium]